MAARRARQENRDPSFEGICTTGWPWAEVIRFGRPSWMGIPKNRDRGPDACHFGRLETDTHGVIPMTMSDGRPSGCVLVRVVIP